MQTSMGVTGNRIDAPLSLMKTPPAAPRSVLVVSADALLRGALAQELRAMRWQAREAGSGAAMFGILEDSTFAAVLLDAWLPDLDVGECVQQLAECCPAAELLGCDGSLLNPAAASRAPRHPWRGELLHAVRRAQQAEVTPCGPTEEAALAGVGDRRDGQEARVPAAPAPALAEKRADAPVWTGSFSKDEILRRHGVLPEVALVPPLHKPLPGVVIQAAQSAAPTQPLGAGVDALPEFVGSDPRLMEVSRRIRLVAHRGTAVLVHGPTGTGKELVARAIHRLSGRGPFIAINCAAIPEALVEAELFGHARGAFTGATQSRTGKIEAAEGGTLFLDEIGELPLQVQSKLLRFLESGEVQRVGENEVKHVQVRVVAATHRKLGAMATEGTFRLDLLHRLSIFLIETPALAGRTEDLLALVAHTLAALAEKDGCTGKGAQADRAKGPRGHAGVEVRKQLSPAALAKLLAYGWPGNVRELAHTLERAWILAGEAEVIEEPCVEFCEALF